MRPSSVRWVGIALLVAGLAITALSVLSGAVRFYLVLIIPVLTSDSAIGSLPLLMIFAGIFLIAISPATGGDDETADDETEPGPDGTRGRPRVGGVVLIGPIPIIFGTDKKMALVSAAIAIVVLAVVVLLLLR
jgi:uncharacterized protein (TIGR00304 family)